MDIRNLIGEATEYDKKEALEVRKPKSWCKSVSAFANGMGGALIFGITDLDEIKGLQDAEGDSEKISEQIKTRLNPIPNFRLRFEEPEAGKKLIVLDVYPGEQTPYYYDADGVLQAFIRIGNQSVSASPMKLQELVLKGTASTYDSLKSKYDFENMAFTKLKSVYKQRTGESFRDSDYESFGIIDEDKILTNAGALIADESPVRHSRVFCTRWNGLDKASGVIDAIDDRELSGGLINLLQDACGFVRQHSHKAWKKTADSRVEMPDYPERAVTEGIVNALIHRNYLEVGSEVHIDIFDDRLEIYSPGGMYDGTKVQERDLMNVPSRRRNPVIADIFSRLKYMDRRGSGFKKILGEYESQPQYMANLKPIFNSDNDAFFLVLKNLNYDDTAKKASGKKQAAKNERQKASGKKRAAKTEENKEAVQAFLGLNETADISAIAAHLGLSKQRTRAILKEMIAEKIVCTEGESRSRVYKLMKES